MHLIAGHQQVMTLLLMVGLSTVCYQEVSAGRRQARVTRSAVESMRDHGTYIIHFEHFVNEQKMRQFVDSLTQESVKKGNFTVEIIKELFLIKCLTARLCSRALKWVTYHESVSIIKENEYILTGSGHVHNLTANVQPRWYLDRLDQESLPLDKTFSVNFTGRNVDVYVLDSGILYEHEEFNGRALYPDCDPIDTIFKESRAGRDCEGHGTHVAGLVGGNSTGVASEVTLFSVRVLDCDLVATEASLIHGLVCVVDHRQRRNGTRAIINLSIAGHGTTASVNKALQLALNNDIIITASAGNGRDNDDDPFKSINYDSCKVYPAGYPGVISVGATDHHDNALIYEFDNTTYITNMGRCLDVFAPGYGILSSDICPLVPCYDNNNNKCISCNNSCKSFKSGTSQSAPLVAGAISLLLEKCPKMTNAQVKYTLRHSLSVNKVKFHNVLHYATNVSFYIITVLETSNDRLLYIGNDLENVTNCSMAAS